MSKYTCADYCCKVFTQASPKCFSYSLLERCSSRIQIKNDVCKLQLHTFISTDEDHKIYLLRAVPSSCSNRCHGQIPDGSAAGDHRRHWSVRRMHWDGGKRPIWKWENSGPVLQLPRGNRSGHVRRRRIASCSRIVSPESKSKITVLILIHGHYTGCYLFSSWLIIFPLI